MVGQEGITVSVDGIDQKSDGTIIAEFNKSKTNVGGPLGTGGILAGDTDTIIEDILEDLTEFIIEQTSKK